MDLGLIGLFEKAECVEGARLEVLLSSLGKDSSSRGFFSGTLFAILSLKLCNVFGGLFTASHGQDRFFAQEEQCEFPNHTLCRHSP